MVINLLTQSESSDKFVFHINELEKLLKNYENHFISVISIAGKLRTGKSFLINWLLKYAKEEKIGLNYSGANENWLKPGKLEGFPFARGRHKLTDGIDLWDEVRFKDLFEFLNFSDFLKLFFLSYT